MSAPIRRVPQLVFNMITGSENTAMMKNSAGLAKPPSAWPKPPTIPKTGHITMMKSAVTPKGSADVTHKDTSAKSKPSVMTPS